MTEPGSEERGKAVGRGRGTTLERGGGGESHALFLEAERKRREDAAYSWTITKEHDVTLTHRGYGKHLCWEWSGKKGSPVKMVE